MIGHAMPAAGIAGLIKAALAVHHGVLPPTLHCNEPHPLLAETRFRVLGEAEPWETAERPRRAGINAFGFGGINAHVVIESHDAPRRQPRAVAATAAVDRVALFAADDAAALLRQMDEVGKVDRMDEVDGPRWQPISEPAGPSPAASPPGDGPGPARLAIANPTPERLAMARKIVERGRPWRGRNDIWFTTRGLASSGGRVAFLFPGVEPNFDPQVDDIAGHFGLVRPQVSRGDLESQGFGVIGVGRLVQAALRELDVRADEIAGHSIGEWSGIVAAGMVAENDLDAFVASLRRGTLQVPDVVFAAVGCSAAKAGAAIEGLRDISVSHDNCPHQAILCGRAESIRAARERLRAQRVLSEELPFRSGFHSPLFADHLAPFLEQLRRIPFRAPHTRLWSATTVAPYAEIRSGGPDRFDRPDKTDRRDGPDGFGGSDDLSAVHDLIAAHFVRPVRFREVIERLYAEGVRVFVQAGLGSLIHFVDDTLKDREHLGISALAHRRGGLSQLRRAAAALFVEGVPVRLARLFGARAAASGPARASGKAQRLALGVPLVRLDRPLDLSPSGPAAPALASGDPLFEQLDATLREAAAAGREVVEALRRRPAPAADSSSASPVTRHPPFLPTAAT